MPATKWTRTVYLKALIDTAADDTAKIPALLLTMAEIVGPTDSSFAEELQEAAADAEDSDTAREDADFWLAQFYDWADNVRVWVA